jgi:hypothetical protein
MIETKRCSKCKVEKQLSDFHNNKNQKNGKHCQCKSCVKINYKYVKKNPNPISEEEIIEKDRLRKLKKSIQNKKYREKNRDVIKENKKIEKQKRLSKNPLVKLRYRISNNISVSLRRKNIKKTSKTQDILGCSFEDFKKHIESLWESWMNWDNYGNPKDGIYELNKNWDLDHLIPSSKAKTEEEIIMLNHYKNFQPLCSFHNRFVKRNI